MSFSYYCKITFGMFTSNYNDANTMFLYHVPTHKKQKCSKLTKLENKIGVEESWGLTRIVDVVGKTTYIN